MSIPSNNHYTESQLNGYYDAYKNYAQDKYGSVQGIQDAVNAALTGEGVNTSDPLVSQGIENVRPLNETPFDSNSTFNSFMRDAYFGGLGGYLASSQRFAWAERTV